MNRAVDRLQEQWSHSRFVCLGLDPQIDMIPSSVVQGSPAETVVAFNRAIIDATADVVAAYKPNLAFFEQFGADGIRALEATVQCIRSHSSDVVIILDAKRADIGSTNVGYAKLLFDLLDADAITVNPYLGVDALQPFLDYDDRLLFVLCRTSNPGSGEFQDLVVDGEPLFAHVARHVSSAWPQDHAALGLVVGATSPRELVDIRTIDANLPLLIPGVGAQGGDVDAVIQAVSSTGPANVLVNSSRAILYADATSEFAARARQVAVDLAATLQQGWSPLP